jgi:CubicO group peptidase (beta-lactamase class C family)
MSQIMSTVSITDTPIKSNVQVKLQDLIHCQIKEGCSPGVQIALAHKGRLVFEESFGYARIGTGHEADAKAVKADNESLWLLYSNTKVILATLLWKFHELGMLRFSDRVSDYIPEFSKNGKESITLFQVITHQSGFPDAEVPEAIWHDHAKIRQAVSNFNLQWVPGSLVSYHGWSAHWVLAMVIEAITGNDYRQVIREQLLEPLSLANDLFLGLPKNQLSRMTFLYEPDDTAPNGLRLRDESTNIKWQEAGVPGGGAYGTARSMVALYQMMLQGGNLNGIQFVSPRTLSYAIKNYTADRQDEFWGMPMQRGLGPHLRGENIDILGLGTLAKHDTFGHGGVGTSYCWADPQSGFSFAYLSNSRIPDDWHALRMNQVSNLVHSCITV